MRVVLQRIPTHHLAAFVVLADATVWLAALPFEFYCRTLLTQRPSMLELLLILLANALLLVFAVSGIAATGELLRRGLTRPVRVALPIFVRAQSKRAKY